MYTQLVSAHLWSGWPIDSLFSRGSLQEKKSQGLILSKKWVQSRTSVVPVPAQLGGCQKTKLHSDPHPRSRPQFSQNISFLCYPWKRGNPVCDTSLPAAPSVPGSPWGGENDEDIKRPRQLGVYHRLTLKIRLYQPLPNSLPIP